MLSTPFPSVLFFALHAKKRLRSPEPVILSGLTQVRYLSCFAGTYTNGYAESLTPAKISGSFRLLSVSLSQSVDLPRVDDFLQELAAIQQTGSKRIALLGSRHVPITHQILIEEMSYALVLGRNRLLTSGATGTNAAAIRGAMRADPNLLTVILPQSLERQPRESREQLEQVIHLVENPDNDPMSLAEASAICNQEIVSRCQQLICFAFHDSHTLLKTCGDAEDQRKIVTLFYFD